MQNIGERAIRGGLAKVGAQAANFAARLGSIMVLSRLLEPDDFGLLAMVTSFTGVYYLFTTAGLSTATVQQTTISNEQISKLFWVNVLVGVVLAALCVLTAPLLVALYHEPRLFWITVVLGVGFVVSGAGVQHSALMERQMRYVHLACIETVGQIVSIVVGISIALAGFGYWALVGSAIALPISYTIGVWVATGWLPSKPRSNTDISTLLRFGGSVTLNGLVVYVAYNLDKILLGRFAGADALGIYNRAFQIINIPTANLNAAISGLAFSALSRIRDDEAHLRRAFLKGYSLINSVTIPITICFGLFANDIVLVVLGPQWIDAATIFTLLAPTILVFGIINPTGWLLVAVGKQSRSLRIAFVIAPLVIGAYVAGLPNGPKGVAFAFSAAMLAWTIPHIFWCVHGTCVAPKDIFRTLTPPFLSALAGALAAYPVKHYVTHYPWPLLRLSLEGATMMVVYVFVLLFVMKQKAVYLNLLFGSRKAAPGVPKAAI